MTAKDWDEITKVITHKELEKTLGRKVYKTEYANIIDLYTYIGGCTVDEQHYMELFKHENKLKLQDVLLRAFRSYESTSNRKDAYLDLCYKIISKITGESNIENLIYTMYWSKHSQGTIMNLIEKACKK